MKRYTSRFLKAVALFYMSFPVGYLIVATLVFDIPGATCVHLLTSPIYYLTSILTMLAGWGLWEMHRWAWYIFTTASAFILYENTVVMNSYSESHHKWYGFAVSVLMVILVLLRMTREIRVPYFFPKIRWWESDPRYRLAVSSNIQRKVTEEHVQGEILDLSASGCFIKTRINLKTDEPVFVKFSLFGLTVECDGIVVWKTESSVTHPKGVGVKFSAISRQSRRNLRMIVKRLRQVAHFYRTSRYLLTPDEFLKKLDEIENKAWSKSEKKSIVS